MTGKVYELNDKMKLRIAAGFSGGALRACCGGGGPYNFNTSAQCGNDGATSCDNPSSYVNWDGYHLTEAAYQFITAGLLDGPYTYPRMNNLCPFHSRKTSRVAQI